MRKPILSLIICCFVLATGFSQEITLSVDTLEGKVRKEKYSYQSIDQYDQNLLVKLGNIDASSGSIDVGRYNIPFNLFALERKLTQTLSVEGTYFFLAQDLHVLSLRLRHYLKRKRLANNLSGTYLAVEYSKIFNNSFLSSDPYFGEDQTLFLQFGNQIKRSRFGYTDFRLYASYQFSSANTAGFSDRWLNLGFNVILGTAWGPTGQRSALPSSPSFANRYEQTLVTIENASLVIGDPFDAFSLSVSIEQELFIKGLTSRTQFSFGYSRQAVPGFLFEAGGLSVSEEVRKYFGLLKKPGANHSEHSFSGIYTGAGLSNTFILEQINYRVDAGVEDRSFSGSDRIIPYLSLGYQERLGKRYFFDLFARYFFFTRISFFDNRTGDAQIFFGTRVGLNWAW